MKQVAKKYSRSRALKQMTATKEEVSAAEASSTAHYFISDNVNSPIDVFQFVQGNEDPAKKVCLCWSDMLNNFGLTFHCYSGSYPNLRIIFSGVLRD